VLCSLDERLYLLAMTRLGVQPAEVVFLDDRLENVEVARHLGMQAILFEENGQAIAALQRALHM
jgi:putative hydrolase of the HAD superfamily